MAESVGEQAARSSVVLMMRRLLGYVIRFAVIAVLARQLDVKAFGVVAIATTCINFMTVFGDAGINTWVIYDRAEGWEARARSAWWLNTVLTLGQCGVAAILTPVVAWVYGESILIPVFAVAIATFFFDQLRIVPDALLQRAMQFRALAARDLIYDGATGALGVVMALLGMGLWSLVLPRLVLSPLMFVASLRLARWSPGRDMLRKEWRPIFKYALPLIGSDVLHTISNDADTMFVGKVLGETAVAYYDTAYQLANLAGRNITSVLVSVTTPVLGKMREAKADLGPVCIRMYRVISLATLPFLAGIFAVSDDLILLVYGAKWAPITTILRVFIVFTSVRSVTTPSGAVFNIIGRTDMSLKMYLILTPLILVGMIAGSPWGVLGVAVGITIARIISGFIGFGVSLALVGAKVRSGLLALVPATVAAVAMGAIVIGVRWQLLAWSVPLWARLAVTVPLGVVAYLGLLRVASRAAFGELFATVAKVSPKLKRWVGRFARTAAV